MAADPDLVRAWAEAWAVARKLPAPVADHGGLRIDTGSPTETRRYVFARATPGLRVLAQATEEPRVFIKLCAPDEALDALTPPRWVLEPACWVMTCRDGPALAPTLAPEYTLQLSTDGPNCDARIVTAAGEIAASGHAAEHAGVFVYDRIVTDAAHRRKGLGRMVMTALCSARRSPDALQVLVATPDGRALYETMGWSVHSPYATVFIPDPRV
jgi:GNAT superfamily N-acetyltransferase